jgi:hypothetical protein
VPDYGEPRTLVDGSDRALKSVGARRSLGR